MIILKYLPPSACMKVFEVIDVNLLLLDRVLVIHRRRLKCNLKIEEIYNIEHKFYFKGYKNVKRKNKHIYGNKYCELFNIIFSMFIKCCSIPQTSSYNLNRYESGIY